MNKIQFNADGDRQFNTTINIRDVKVQATVTIKVQEDDIQIEDVYDDSVESFDAVRARFERDDLFLGCILVTASALGLEGVDALGACELSCNNMFNSKPYKASVQHHLDEHGMVESALDELKQNLKCEYSRLIGAAQEYKQFASKGE